MQKKLHVLHVLCSIGIVPFDLPSKLLDFIKALENGLRTETIEDNIHLIHLVDCVHKVKEDETLLLTRAFLRGCKLLTKLLKSYSRNKQKSISLLLGTLMGEFTSLLERISAFDQGIVSSCSDTIDKAIIACLKYGLLEAEDQSTSGINEECLKFVRSIVRASSVSLGSFSPGQIHAMAISHSSFQRTVSGEISKELGSSDAVTQQSELIRLLISCVSLDADHVQVTSDTWVTILSAYNASTCDIDRLLRRLIFLYDMHKCHKEEVGIVHIRHR